MDYERDVKTLKPEKKFERETLKQVEMFTVITQNNIIFLYIIFSYIFFFTVLVSHLVNNNLSLHLTMD